MSTFALTPTGVETQTQEEIVAELTASLRAVFGNNLNTSTESIMGQLVDIVAEFRAFDQQVLLQVYRAFDPNSALGVALDRLANLTGSARKGALFSEVDGLLEFSAAGSAVDGDLINNDDNSTQWQVIGGPYPTTGGPFPEFVPATFQAVIAGPTLAQANTNWSLVTAVVNLTAFTNPTDDADPGRLQESDPNFRVRRQDELFSANQGPLAAIKGVVSKVTGVTAVRVYHNPSQTPTDADGIPFKAFNTVVETSPTVPSSALEQSIADAIFSGMGAGGEAFGTDVNKSVTDEEGEVQPNIRFDLIDQLNIFVNVTVDTTGTEDPISENLRQVVADAILSAANTRFRDIGRDQLGFEYVGIVNNLTTTGQITGVTAVTVTLSSVAQVGPFFDPLPVGIRERPNFESSQIVVTVI